MTVEYNRRRSRHAKRRGSRGVILALLACLCLAIVAAGFVAAALWPRWPGAAALPDAPSLPITIGHVVFNVPPAAIRRTLQRRAGPQERLDLAFIWPSLNPPDPAPGIASSKETDAPNPLDRLFVTINPATSELAPRTRMQTIYPRYLNTQQSAGPDGLTMIAFRDGTPYQGEDLFFETGPQARFVVRCTKPGSGATPGTCLWENRMGDADITIRFTRGWLGDWRKVANGIDRLIAGLRAQGG